MIRARFAPHHTPAPLPGGLWPPVAGPRRAVVIGAGLAGCAAAWALCREGWQVQMIDRHGRPAQEASGNPGGLYHSIVHAQDGPHARAHRAAALQTHAWVAPRILNGDLAGQCEGLLRLEPRLTPEQATQRLIQLGLPADHVRWATPLEATDFAGVPQPCGGWMFGQAGWVHPAGLANSLLQAAQACGGLFPVREAQVAGVRRADDGQWEAFDAQGAVLDRAPVMVLANAQGMVELLQQVTSHDALTGAQVPTLSAVRGQITWLPAALADQGQARLPQHPVAGGGYALALGDGRLLCGATSQHHDNDPAVREADHLHNLSQAQRLGCLPQGHPADCLPMVEGRTGWRAVTPDRLPCVGAVARAPAGDTPLRTDPVRRRPRWRDAQGGLYVIGGLGSRGITWSLLAGRLLAHWVCGTPCPVEVDLRDALDPARTARPRAPAHHPPAH